MPDADGTTGDLASPEGEESLLLADTAGSAADDVTGTDGVDVSTLEAEASIVIADVSTEQDLPTPGAGTELDEPRAESDAESGLPAAVDESDVESATGGSESEADVVVDGSEPGNEDVLEDETVEPVYELDAVLVASEERAREALADVAPPGTIGPLVATLAQGEHVVSLQFANLMRGYPGWLWTATLSRIDETEEVNVLEVELLPGEGAVLAPDWVPWTDRLADYRAAQDAAGEESDDSDEDDTDDDDDEADEDAPDSEDEFDDQVVLDDDDDESEDDDDSDDDDESDDDDGSDDDDESDDDETDDDDRDDDDR
ncbi:DUF3027 domain-containing protein [Rathayibacter caricis]|uniref:DUF3027 domain-containing protein n=1 Tax=Rathayibacter caricis TaxID=110936 RepID=UPI001FB3363D|nr:DUF3027 domain-containing protein [Rathayibacter caricis]MCJ1695214.1 DUF3027 domain-containing protein [Rathayibacter caricis]